MTYMGWSYDGCCDREKCEAYRNAPVTERIAFDILSNNKLDAPSTKVEFINCNSTTPTSALPPDAAERKAIPIASGVLDYFPAALAEIAKVSKAGNDQHNAGEPLHWARGKSADQSDALIRHFLERGSVDGDGHRHSAKMAWRALALLQIELEVAGAPVARGARE
jgi:hypothetical protein